MERLQRGALIAVTSLALAACATRAPMDGDVTSKATPSEAVAAMPALRGERVQWGGHIVSISNEARNTNIEILSYPLARGGFPDTGRKPTGRFVLRHPGFLEPMDYAPGKLITATGTVSALATTAIQETELLVPLIEADRLKLWDERYDRDPRFGIGLGISVGF